MLLSSLFALVAAQVAAAQISADARFPASARLHACKKKDLDPTALCGIARVPENRQAKRSRLIDIHYVVVPAKGAPSDDPLVVLPGGPGAGGAESAAGIAQLFASLREKRDLLLIDQRGTGESNPLKCPGGLSDNSPIGELGGSDPAKVDICRRQLQQKADVRFYHTREAVLDMEQVRQALGYKRLDLFGVSYGTRVALDYLRLFPDRVGQTVIRGAAPVDMRIPLTSSRDLQRSFERLASLCSRQPDCAQRHDLRGYMRAIEQRLDRRGPPQISIKHPKSGKMLTGKLDRLALGTVMSTLLYMPQLFVQLPPLLERAAKKDNFSPLAQAAAPFAFGAGDALAWGQYNSVVCNEDVRFIPSKLIKPMTKGTFVGRSPIDNLIESCAHWPAANVPADYRRPVRSAKSVLIISGEIDPVAGDSWGAHVAATLPNSVHLVVPGASHLPPLNSCTGDLVARFLDGTKPRELDTSCVAKIVPPRLKTA